MATGALVVPLVALVIALAAGSGGGKTDVKLKAAYDAGFAKGKSDAINGMAEQLNPAVSVTGASPKQVAAYEQGYKDGYAANKKKSGPGPVVTPAGFKPTQEQYVDSNGVRWNIMNSAPNAYRGELRTAQPNYDNTPINGSTRAYVVSEIIKRAAAAKAKVDADKTAGYNAGYADGQESCAGANSFISRPVINKRWQEGATTSWKQSYRDAFDSALAAGGCSADEDGQVIVNGASGNPSDFKPHTPYAAPYARRGLPRHWYNM